MNRFRLLLAYAIASGAGCLAWCSDLVAPAGSIDATIVLRIGSHEISRYAVEKNLKRFISDSSPGKVPSAPAERQRRFESFLVRQVIIAEALAQGYGRRPEVETMVEMMERQILAQADGPLFKALYGDVTLGPGRLRELYALRGRVPHVVAARLPGGYATEFASPVWADASPEQRLKKLRALAARDDGIVFYQGPLPWPHEPLPELETSLVSAVPGSWIQWRTRGFVTVAWPRSIEQVELPPFEQAEASFTGFALRREHVRLWREREARMLGEVGFKTHRAAIAQVVDAIKRLPRSASEIPAESTALYSSDVVASFRDGAEVAAITVEQWRIHYNRRIARRRPENAAMLDQMLRGMVTEELDVREARRLGLDRTPQLREDRRNFRSYQALDLFEKEVLVPKITISDWELRQHYQTRRADYFQPIGARGRILVFSGVPAASSWLQRRDGFVAQGKLDPATPPAQEAKVSREQPLPGAVQATDLILRLADGQAFGPVRSADNRAIVFVKESTEKEPVPFEKAAGQIRDALLRERLDVLEAQLAREWAAKFVVRDDIPYEDFSVSPTLNKPWEQDRRGNSIDPGVFGGK